MGSWGDDVGLLYLVLLNAAVLAASWRLARRRTADALDAAGDALLLFYFVQYVSVCLTGLVGAMHALTIGLVALLGSAVMALGIWGNRRRDDEGNAENAGDEGERGDGGREGGREGASGAAGGVGAAKARRRTRAAVVVDRRERSPSSWRELWLQRRDRAVVAGAILFVVGYVALLVYHQRRLPVISNDAITYHLPAAVQWLQTGRMGLYEAWYYNPANSYSPLGGSVFVAWLIAPVQNDSVARFVAVGPLVLLMIAMLNLCRRLGASTGVAAVVAATCVLARPFMSQAILAKDDLFVAAFFVLAVDALARQRLATRSGPTRAGIALGLLLAMKFTVLFSLPLLLLMFNRAWTWRRLISIAGLVLLIAGPWYLRNVRLTGNPLFPSEVTVAGVTIFQGIIDVGRSRLLQTAGGAWEVFTGGYYGLSVPVAVVLIAGWVGAVVVALMRRRAIGTGAMGDARAIDTGDESTRVETAKRPRRRFSEPLVRTCVVGPVIGIAIFVLTAPYGEMRFAYPSVALLFACVAIALSRAPWSVGVVVATAVALLAALTAFPPGMSRLFVASGAVVALPAMLIALAPRPRAIGLGIAAAGAACLVLALIAYVHWAPYVRQAEADSAVAWSDPGVYGAIGEVWHFVRTGEEISPGIGGPDDARGAAAPAPRGGGGASTTTTTPATTIAYANTFFTYPLMGYRYEHRVVHAPTRRDVESFRDLPRLPHKVTGEELVRAVVDELAQDPDRDAWLRRLRESGAQFLVVAKYDPAAPAQRIVPHELRFAEQDPKRFVRIFDNEAGSVYRIVW